jgi:hypothetical protein
MIPEKFIIAEFFLFMVFVKFITPISTIRGENKDIIAATAFNFIKIRKIRIEPSKVRKNKRQAAFLGPRSFE